MGETSMSFMRKITYFSTLLLIFALPWEDSISIAGLGSLARLMGFAAAGLWLSTVIVEGRLRRPNLFHVLVLLFILWNFVTLFWSSDTEDSLRRIKTYTQVFLLLLIYWDVYRKPQELLAGLKAYILGAYVLIGSTVYNYLTNNIAVQYEGRYSASGINANDVALILILGMPIVMPVLMERFSGAQRSTGKILLYIINILYYPLAIFATFLTGSRTSLIAVIPLFVFLLVTKLIKIERKILIFAVFLVSLLIILSIVPQSLIERISTIGNSISQADLGGRVAMWQKSIYVLAQHPVSGIGCGAIDRTIGGAVHNTLISVATETGTIGLALFLSILGLVLYDVLKLPAGISGIWLAIFITWGIGAVSLSWEFRKLTWILLNFIVIESCLKRDERKTLENTSVSNDIQRFSRGDELVSQSKVIG
jgi:O-antigen ligase